jgi:hypothetical protein
LREALRVLKPGCHLYVETPDFKRTIENVMRAFEDKSVERIHVWTTSLYGKSEREGMAHHWGFYSGLMRKEMRHQGFTEIETLDKVEDMISTHYKQEPVLLIKGTK